MGIFLGDTPVEIYFNGAAAGLPVQGVFLGPVQVFPTGTAATVPGKPTITGAEAELDDGNYVHIISFIPPEDGGSPITEYRVYLDDVFVESLEQSSTQRQAAAAAPADNVRMSAVNAIGEGPKSDPFTVTLL